MTKRTTFPCLLLLFSASTALAGQIQLSKSASYPTGSGPMWADVGDLNNDKVDDIVTNNALGGTISVLLGNGNGTFQPKIDYPAGTQYYTSFVALVDMNSDGNLDIVVDDASKGVGILKGRGDGTLNDVEFLSGDHNPFGQMAVKDINNDNLVDIAYPTWDYPLVGVRLGRSGGGFEPLAEYDGGPATSAVETADMNNDGLSDLIVANNTTSDGSASSVSVLLATKKSSYNKPRSYLLPMVAYLGTVQVADLNDDQIPDVLTAGGGAGPVFVFFGRSDGTLGRVTAYPTSPNLSDSNAGFALGDIDMDGIQDLVSGAVNRYDELGNALPNIISIRRGNKHGGFGKLHKFPGKGGGWLADLDGDDKTDLFSADTGNNTSLVNLNQTKIH